MEKYKRALNRLEDLYLFDDEGMSEKDYLLKKQKLETKLKEIDEELKNTNKIPTLDLSFLNDVVLKNELLKKIPNDKKVVFISNDNIEVDYSVLKPKTNILKLFYNLIHYTNGKHTEAFSVGKACS